MKQPPQRFHGPATKMLHYLHLQKKVDEQVQNGDSTPRTSSGTTSLRSPGPLSSGTSTAQD